MQLKTGSLASFSAPNFSNLATEPFSGVPYLISFFLFFFFLKGVSKSPEKKQKKEVNKNVSLILFIVKTGVFVRPVGRSDQGRVGFFF